jgi:hypothetical protein
MKVIITETQYKNLFESTSNFEKEKKLIETLLFKFNYDGICRYDILADDKTDKVSSVMVGYSQEWYNEDVGRSYEYIVKIRKKIEQNIKKYLGLENVYIGLFNFETCE